MKRILIFLLFTFGITYAIDYIVIAPIVAQYGYGTNPITIAVVASTMFVPALSVLLTRWVTREGFRDVWIRPHFKGHVSAYLLAWFLPPVLAAVGAVVFFLCYPAHFDPTCSDMIAKLQQAGGAMPFDADKVGLVIVSQLVTSVLFAPLLNCVACFGEEWGWRGYLLPKTLDLIGGGKSPKPSALIAMLLVNGLIWGLWHAPIIAMGHNYGTDYPGYPWVGILTMCFFTFSIGVLFSYLSWKAHSCLPGVVGHGAINGIAAGANFFAIGNPNMVLGPTAAGILGGSALFVTACVVIGVWIGENRRHPIPAAGE